MEETIRAFDRILSIVGITIYSKTNWNSKLWLIWQTINFIIGSLIFIFTTGFVFVSISDIVLWIEGACIWTTGVIMFIILGVCLVFRREFKGFLDEMVFKDGMMEMPFAKQVMEFERSGKVGELKQMLVSSQQNLLKYTRLLLKSYLVITCLCATMYIFDAVYQMLTTKDDSLRILAFKMWFPWSLQDLRVYTASFILHAHGGYLCCIAYPGLQSTIILLIGQVIRQLRILGFILFNLDDLVMELVYERDERWQMYCTDIFSQCVEHYVILKRFSNRLNVICRPFYLALILVAIMLVCVCSVKIAISDKLSPDTMKYYIHEISYVLVVLMFCLLGQQVQNECEKLEKVVTEKWYIFNRRHQVNVLIFERALSQRMPIYIFGTIPLSLPTFTWFIKTGMSFFTLVMSVLEEN